MTRTGAVLLGLAIALTSACASTGRSGAARRDPNEITVAELAEASITSLSCLDAINRLRPGWLRQRGASSTNAAGDVLPKVMNIPGAPMEMMMSGPFRKTGAGNVRDVPAVVTLPPK